MATVENGENEKSKSGGLINTDGEYINRDDVIKILLEKNIFRRKQNNISAAIEEMSLKPNQEEVLISKFFYRLAFISRQWH